jgi:hypothetical protein
MLEKLEEIYGIFADKEKNWIEDNLKYLSESEISNFIANITSAYPSSKGTPDVDALTKALAKTTGKQPKSYYWAVCLECHKEYDYNLPICPHCFKEGLECRAKAVKKSDMKPNADVIKFNKTYLGDGKEQICYGCEHNELSFCKHFGDETWLCQRNEYEQCECKICCAEAKKVNRIRLKAVDTSKFSYAKPLRKIVIGDEK